ncbi:Krueppel homolog 1 [Anopheles cruzii]|uniref:Krueppel homolog 1 n=1 Tax=Anopheles cruzii TaxID=68878 RepID=UPI0022EC1D5B|nr:Krueppel homolog 1 [Anopheles cruzii]
MKKGSEGSPKVTKKAAAVAAAAAAAATLAENVDLWARQDWIKDILSKSGTEIKEVPAEDLCKMVYYSGLPLLMTQQQQQQQQQQIAVHDGGGPGQLGYGESTGPPTGDQLYRTSASSSPTIGYQQHAISLSNGLTISNGAPAVSGPSSQVTIVLSPHSSSSSSSSTQQPNITNLTAVPGGGSYTLDGSGPYGPSGGGGSPAPAPVATGGNSKFRCEQCNINFGSKSAHTSHMKSHAKQAAEKAATIKQLDGPGVGQLSPAGGAGQQQQQQQDPYQCDVCKKTFAVPARLVRHYRTHTGERPFECEFCHKMFSVKENLQVHRRIHTKERPYKCEICGRAFEHSGKLHRHMRIHTGERPHKCNVCGKTFIQSGQLVIHMRTHTGEKPYKCPVEGCGKGFTCSKQLKVHSRTHTGEKPYHCDICFRDFGYNHVLKLHRVQHYGAKCYKCTICDETFKSKKEMEAHIKGHANELPDDDETETVKAEESSASSEVAAAVVVGGPAGVVGVGAGSNSSSSGGSSSRSSNFEYSSSAEEPESNGSCDEPAGGRPAAEVRHEEEDEDEEDDDEEDEEEQRESKYSDRILVAYDGRRARDHQEPVFGAVEQRPSIPIQQTYGASLGGVDPALLAAASIAAAVENGLSSVEVKLQRSLSPSVQRSTSLSITRITPPPSSSMQEPATVATSTATSSPFPYEPMGIMKHHGYFAPASQVTDFRSSSDIVRQVEAAIAGTENLLTPPRSSPESPDRSSSPESDSVLMADRDNNTLPPRKRKLYFKDSQVAAPKVPALVVPEQRQNHTTQPQQVTDCNAAVSHLQQQQPLHSAQQPQLFLHQQQQQQQQQHYQPCEVTPSSPPPPPQTVAPSVIRMSSVIQYANKSS